jgi:hypothetical protein
MKKVLGLSLLVLALYTLASQALSWYLILFYTSQQSGLVDIARISASGALGLAVGQCVNTALIFRFGPYRLVGIAAMSVCCLMLVSLGAPLLWRDMLSRFFLGWMDGIIFLIIETSLVLNASVHMRAKSLAAYLFTLYAMQVFSPMLARCMLQTDILVIASLCCSAILSCLTFQAIPFPLNGQVPSYEWNLGEMTLVRQGFLGAILCGLSGALLPLWTAFIPFYLEGYSPDMMAFIASIFLIGGLTGQLLLYLLKGKISSLRCVQLFLILGMGSSIGLLIHNVETHITMTAILLSILGIALYPLYALGIDLALERIDASLWVRANKTLLSCYTIPAILSPLMFSYLPINISSILPGVSLVFLGMTLIFCRKRPAMIDTAHAHIALN